VSAVASNVDTKVNGLLTDIEAAAWLKLSPRQVFNLRNRGYLAFVKIGRSIRFRISDLEAFAASLSRREDGQSHP